MKFLSDKRTKYYRKSFLRVRKIVFSGNYNLFWHRNLFFGGVWQGE